MRLEFEPHKPCYTTTSANAMTMSVQNGSFVVRNSRTAGLNKPYVITILCRREIFHVPIRLRTKDSYYAVGEEKSDELVSRMLIGNYVMFSEKPAAFSFSQVPKI